jgi:hypothetical protein
MIVEPVYSVWDYYDGILTGVADYRGSPHYFEKDWSEEQRDYLPTFALTPITEAELAEVVERERVFRVWKARFHRGEVEASTHPSDASGEASYVELQATFKARVVGSLASLRRSTPEFSPVPGQPTRPNGVVAQLQVAWHDAA